MKSETVARLERIRSFSDVRWTHVTPPFNLEFDDPATGEYIIGGEDYFTNDKGESHISYKDFASAMLDCARVITPDVESA